MTRIGNGFIESPAKGVGAGDGWGGPARGARAAGSEKSPPFASGNRAPAGPHDKSRSERRQTAMDQLFELAMTAKSQETQVSAAVAWLNRAEGMPVAKSVNANTDDLSALDDDALAAKLAAF